MPKEYQFKKSILSFRQFVNNYKGIFNNHKVRSLVTKTEEFRKLIIQLRVDMGEDITPFNPPKVNKNTTPLKAAKQIRTWLGVNDSFDFSKWKELLENKGVFIFLTSKYAGWSHIERDLLRGMTIFHKKLPIIIINDSDAKKAQSFTLFHELGHLLRKESAIDDWDEHNLDIERWCNEFAGNVLMPSDLFSRLTKKIDDLDQIKKIADKFKVSPYACLVRLRQLEKISQSIYIDFKKQLVEEFVNLQKKLKASKGGPPRNRAKEVYNQYGHIYTSTLFQAYYNQEIGLHKLSSLFNLKKLSYVFEMESIL